MELSDNHLMAVVSLWRTVSIWDTTLAQNMKGKFRENSENVFYDKKIYLFCIFRRNCMKKEYVLYSLSVLLLWADNLVKFLIDSLLYFSCIFFFQIYNDNIFYKSMILNNFVILLQIIIWYESLCVKRHKNITKLCSI